MSVSVNKSGTNSCILLEPDVDEFKKYCKGGSIDGIVLPHNTLKIIKTIYSHNDDNSKAYTEEELYNEFKNYTTSGTVIPPRISYLLEILAAKKLVTIDPKQEHFLYALGGCELSMHNDTENIKSLDEKCDYKDKNTRTTLPNKVYLLEMQKGGLSLIDKRQKVFTDDESKMILNKIIEILEILHTNKITHGDLQGGNILIDYDENNKLRVKFIDFSHTIKHDDDHLEYFKQKLDFDIKSLYNLCVALGSKTIEGAYRQALISVGGTLHNNNPPTISIATTQDRNTLNDRPLNFEESLKKVKYFIAILLNKIDAFEPEKPTLKSRRPKKPHSPSSSSSSDFLPSSHKKTKHRSSSPKNPFDSPKKEIAPKTLF